MNLLFLVFFFCLFVFQLHGVRFVNSVVKRAQKWIERENAGRFAKLTSWLRLEGNDDDDEEEEDNRKGGEFF